MAEARKPVAAREEELRAQYAKTQPEQSADKSDKEEWDGTGNRLVAVRRGDADPELVANGMTQVPNLVREVKTDDHTGRFISETTFGKPKGREVEEHVTFHEGDVVEGLSDEELRPLISSGAVRRETKDEARDK